VKEAGHQGGDKTTPHHPNYTTSALCGAPPASCAGRTVTPRVQEEADADVLQLGSQLVG
jgi:hypothetical protein